MLTKHFLQDFQCRPWGGGGGGGEGVWIFFGISQYLAKFGACATEVDEIVGGWLKSPPLV